MNIKKEQYDKELRKYVFPFQLFTKLMTKKWGVKFTNRLLRSNIGKAIEGLDCDERYIPSKSGGPDIRVRIFKSKGVEGPLPALLYNHGGGYMLDYPEGYLDFITRYTEHRPCVIVAPDYRRSIDEPYPAGFNDCYDTLLWMKENATSLNIRSDKFMIGGHSAGGGLTAALTLKARDTKDVNIAFQMPNYPMIDYRQITESAKAMENTPVWNSKTNAFAWDLYLRDVKDDVPLYASPALNQNYEDFPPTITFVGDYEPFKDETINYVNDLKRHNIPVKFELFEGVFHGFDLISAKSTIGQKANKFQYEAFAEFYDKYML